MGMELGCLITVDLLLQGLRTLAQISRQTRHYLEIKLLLAATGFGVCPGTIRNVFGALIIVQRLGSVLLSNVGRPLVHGRRRQRR